MSLFKKKGEGILDIIRCDEPSYLIWKWRPDGMELGQSIRENAIRTGSRLRVNEGSVAAFFYDSIGEIDYIMGPFDQTIKTANMPILSGILGAFFKGDSPFQAEIYFINLAKEISIRFAVPFFDVYDHRFSDFGVPVAVRGSIHFKIADYKEFVRLHRLRQFEMEDFEGQIRDTVVRYIKNIVASASARYSISVLQLESQIDRISSIAEEEIKRSFKENFAIDVKRVDISDIDVDKTSDEYFELKSVTSEIDRRKEYINLNDYEERQRINREEEQYATRKQTESANFAAYQLEKQAQVSIAGAEALGNMDGSIYGTGNGGFNPVTMMAGMAIGGAVGQNIGNTVGGMMASINQPVNQAVIPPPIPQIAYYVAVNGQAEGPFDYNILVQMTNNKSFTKNSLVWKKGMPDWVMAGSVDELKNLFNDVPPIPSL